MQKNKIYRSFLQVFAINLITSGFVLSANANERKETFITFDVPGANLGTIPTSISNGGVITGGYAFSPFDVPHGFVRGRDGTFVTFDPQNTSFGTFPVGINSEGEVTGQYSDTNGFYHGFLRQKDGFILTFDPLGSVNTSPVAINEPGEITGWYVDSNLLTHGFLRAKDGTLTTFDAPGTGSAPFPWPFPRVSQPSGDHYRIL
jgi:hypothetical protein